MDTKRVTLYASIAFVIFLLWNAWQKDYPSVKETPVAVAAESTTIELPPPSSHLQTTGTPAQKEKIGSGLNLQEKKTIQIQTDVLKIIVDLNQGNIIGANLLAYPEREHSQSPFSLLYEDPSQRYVASSMLVSPNGRAFVVNSVRFHANQPSYQLAADQSTLVVTLDGETETGLKVSKLLTLTRGSYLIQVDYIIKNQGTTAWVGMIDTRLTRQAPPSTSGGLFQIGTYTGASYSEPGVHRYQKIPFEEMNKQPLNIKTQGGWIAMQQHYFLTAWIPNTYQHSVFYTQSLNDTYSIGAMNDVIQITPGQKIQTGIKLYLGPEIDSVLKTISPGLDLTIDYGWFWFISSVLMTVMKMIKQVVGNWGWSIIIITIVIKLLFYQLSAKSYHSMANMRQLQPKLEALKTRYGDDKAKLSQATMELYKQEKINPLGGCLPIIVQIPVFIALYWALIESVEFRQAPFIFWINDLSSPDPLHVLPILMGLSMLIQQRLNPTPPDPMQAKMMMFLPILFTALFWNFPSGLVLYWIVNNVLSILQQWWITRKVETMISKRKK